MTFLIRINNKIDESSKTETVKDSQLLVEQAEELTQDAVHLEVLGEVLAGATKDKTTTNTKKDLKEKVKNSRVTLTIQDSHTIHTSHKQLRNLRNNPRSNPSLLKEEE